MRIESGKYSVGIGHSRWYLNESGKRSFRDTVNFSEPFAEPPKIITGITSLDIRNGYSTSVIIEVQNVTREGFSLRIDTNEGGIQELTLSWTAIAA